MAQERILITGASGYAGKCLGSNFPGKRKGNLPLRECGYAVVFGTPPGQRGNGVEHVGQSGRFL